MNGMYIAWHNFRTGETDYRNTPPSPEEIRDYFPQDRAAFCLYEFCREQGDDHLTAAELVYLAVLSETRRRGENDQGN